MTALLQQSTVGLNYKTILCKNFSTMGVCKYGTSCHFAHGELDIKKPVHLLKINLILGINSCDFFSLESSYNDAIS